MNPLLNYQFVYKATDKYADGGSKNPQPIFTGLMSQTSSNMDIGVAVRRSRSPLELLSALFPADATLQKVSFKPVISSVRNKGIADGLKTLVAPLCRDKQPFAKRPSTCDQASPLMIRTSQAF